MTFNVGDEVLYIAEGGTFQHNYYCIVTKSDPKFTTATFIATGFDSSYTQGRNFGACTFPTKQFILASPPLSTEQLVKKKTQYLWNKSKWGKAHPLTQ